MLATLSLRNIWRNRRRSLLTISVMVVSSSLLILALGVFSGMLADVLASATELYYGHALISAKGYQDDRSLYTTLDNAEEILSTLKDDPRIEGASARLRIFGLASHDNETRPVELLGVDYAAEAEVTLLSQRISNGSQPTSGGMIGAALAERLGVQPGDEIVLVTQAADGSIGNALLTIDALMNTGDPGIDLRLILAPLTFARELVALPEGVHEIALHLTDPMLAQNIVSEIAPRLPAETEALPWGSLLPEMREAIASFDVSRGIMITILYLATGLGIVNTFFMSVLERTREFGIMMAIGMRPWQVRMMVLGEALSMGILSLAAGLILGLLMTWYMQRVGIDLSAWISPITYAGGSIPPRLTATFDARNILPPALLLLVVALFAALLPANRAARLNPAGAIRED